MRARIFFNGEYVTTVFDVQTCAQALRKSGRQVHSDDEVIVYLDDFFWELSEDEQSWHALGADAPKVRGLYAKAVAAELAAAAK